ncbi:murein L,D-transpeptidase [Mucilaginibacter sp. UR6-11]|uniref:L,D-transpeptidase family protein n=1 Tax=Mucilaginibacter sp. UR6-11 TaxID=1435644 RepID=UPI001E55A8E3|nr:L,D-transpeptidase family protein [Mucilaginibacter sp. UR6-11]MCC8425503.1 L,D-transpeptidase family protein [Mucilaginibacter sp. UR6-11]
MALVSLGLSCNSCGQQPNRKTAAGVLSRDMTVPGNFSGQSEVVFDSTQIAPFLKRYPAFQTYAGEIDRFYHNRNYAYAWFENGALIEQAGNLVNRMLNLANEGIAPPAPYPKELDSLIHTWTKGKPDLRTELMLTAQYFVYARLAWQGLGPAVSRSAGWYLPRKRVDYATYLDSLLKAPATPEPVYRQYDLLRSFLRKYRNLDEQYRWDKLPMPLKSLRPGDTAAVIPSVRARLHHLGDLRGDTLSTALNLELQTALRQFQARHGLDTGGLLTKETMAELNVPLKSRIEQLMVNMERSRWLPVRLDADYLGVNIPEFKLHVYHADSLLWSCNVVVGQTVHPTSVFYGEIKYVVFSPYWDVPQSIVRKEILPAMKKHPDYLAAHHMQITGYAAGLPVIRQLPGPDNSLGLVKFLLPNSFHIYLHDTPAKSLFGETARAFSHGCIRVQEPAKLAAFLLNGQQGWDAEKIRQAMHAGKERYVTLPRKVPVFIAYLTAFTDRNGRLNFRKDIYQLDKELASMLLIKTVDY